MAVIHEGELVVQIDTPLKPGPPERVFDRSPRPTVAAAAPAASLAEIDRAIGIRRETIAREDEAIASFKKRIAGPAPNRLKSLLTGATDDKNELAQKIHEAAQRRDSATKELQELLDLREPLAAQDRAHQYDVTLCPKLRAALSDLGRHLSAAEGVLLQTEVYIREGEVLRGMDLARGVQFQKRTGAELLPGVDARELGLLRSWHADLVGDGMNHSRLRVWRDDVLAAGIELRK